MSKAFQKPVLGIDTSLSGCVVGLLRADGARFERVLKTDRDQAAKLIPLIQEVMIEGGVSFDALGLIVTTVGPGSFTGLRIGMTSAITLGLANAVPVQGVDTISVMTKSCADADVRDGYLCVIETKRADFYAGIMNPDFKWVIEPFSAPSKDIIEACGDMNLILCGDGCARFTQEAGAASFGKTITRDLVESSALCDHGLAAFAAGGFSAQRPEPLYLRGADVSKSTKVQRKIHNIPLHNQ